jgi:hypothetical protein
MFSTNEELGRWLQACVDLIGQHDRATMSGLRPRAIDRGGRASLAAGLAMSGLHPAGRAT